MNNSKENSSNLDSENLLFLGFPSMGMVGAFAISYLAHHLKMERVGELNFSKITPTFIIQKGKMLGPVQIYRKNNVYAILCGLTLDLISAYEFTKSAVDFAKKNKIKKIIIPRGLPIIGKQTTELTSFGLPVNKNSESLLKKYHLSSISNASIFGAEAGVISALRDENIPSIILYTACRPIFPDPEATIQSISTLAKILNVKIETEKIKKSLESITKKNRRLIEETRKMMQREQENHSSITGPGIA